MSETIEYMEKFCSFAVPCITGAGLRELKPSAQESLGEGQCLSNKSAQQAIS
jgi:hypothetical protein